MGISALTTNADELDKCIGENEKREQERKDEQLYDAIERKVKKEKHRRENPKSRDGTIKKCIRLLKEGASPEVLTKLEESLREQEKYYRYYVQCFLPVLNRKILKELDPIKKEEIGQVISDITRNSKYCNQNDRRNSEDSGIGSDSDERQTNDKEPLISKSRQDGISFNDHLLEAAKRGNKKKIKKFLQKGADISKKDDEDNNTLHYVVSFERKQKVVCLKLILGLVKEGKISQDKLSDAINPKEGQTPLQKLLFSKITKGEHGSESVSGKFGKFLKRPFTEYDDHTIESAIRLFELGAKVDDLQLSKEELQNLEEYREYYLKFLEKLAESVKKPKLKPEIKINTEAKIKEIISYTINTSDSNNNYPLHSVIKKNDKKPFEELLQKGADISLKDIDGNNALHLIITTLEKKQKLEFLNVVLNVSQEKGKELLKEQFIKAVNGKDGNGQTPLHQLLWSIKEKSEDRSCTDRKFEKTNRYKTLKLLLENGADITAQDEEGNNALHYVASFEGEQKVTCLELILNLKDEFSKAANATNKKKQTPLQVALITKTIKDKHKWINPKSRDNTIKFCVKLLQNGVDPKQLILPESLWNREYYTTIKGIEKLIGRSLISDDMRTELKCNFGKKFKARDIVKYVNNVVCKVVTTLVFVALTCAVVFSAAQGSITIATASSIIAAIGVCYLVFLNLENIYEGFKKLREKPTEEKQITPQGNASKNDTQYNNSVQNIENKLNNSEKQEMQEPSEPSDQQEHIESFPDTKMSAISIMNSLKNCVGIV